MNAENILDQVRIASPCHARWEDMAGDDRARFCGQCSKHVYNLSAMTREEAESLIRNKDGRLCTRYYQRADGRILTTDCPSGLRRRQNRLKRMGGAFIATLLFLVGARTSVRSQSTNNAGTNRALMGDIAYTNNPATNPPTELLGEVAVKPAVMGRMAMPHPATTNQTNQPNLSKPENKRGNQ